MSSAKYANDCFNVKTDLQKIDGRNQIMKACNEKLRSALKEAMSLAEAQEKKEMAGIESHKFSEEFEQKMDELLMQTLKCRQRRKNLLRYMAAVMVIGFLSVGVLVSRTVTTDASWFGIDIMQWLEEFFQVDAGEGKRKDDSVLFEESQIGYLPEGFEKMAEHVSFSVVYYEYQNDKNDYINLHVVRDKSMLTSDGTEILIDEGINADGYEYQHIQKKDTRAEAVIWNDRNEIYYSIISTLNEEEIMKVMNEITY